ncbi:MAG: LOG family protein, partial [Fimbriimonadaceae bacterium]|nr:LOG family protein [Alphaproteobacteria bacterium]
MTDDCDDPTKADGSETATRDQRVRALTENETFRLAFADSAFLEQDDQRAIRLQLEYLKPEQAMRRENVRSTIVVFGSARLQSDCQLEKQIKAIREALKKTPKDKVLLARLEVTNKRKKYTKYYDEACKFASIVSRKFQTEGRRDFVVVTGGGPGIMEAANKGAYEAGGRSIGFNILLPKEQNPNPYISDELCFQFRYFALRKLHFLMRARALVAFPGGFGTLDEVFEVLTLVQTGKVSRI